MKTRLLIFLLFISILTNANEADYGLYIKSYPYKTSELTNLVLENGQPIQLNEDLVLSFDVYVRNDNVFGSIFRLLTEKDENIDLLITVGMDDRRYPIFVVNESIYPIQQEVTREQWTPVVLTLSPKTEAIKLQYADEEIVVQYPISKSKSFKTVFGLCQFDGKVLADVASVNLRNVRVLKNNAPFRFWELREHNNQVCYDSVAGVPAIALNPQWLVDGHVTWKEILNLQLPQSPSVTYNPDADEFYIVYDSKEVIVFDAATRQQRNVPVKSGLYAANSPNQLLYLPQKKALLSYNMDEDIYSTFDFNSQAWSSHTPNTKEHSYWNNSVVMKPDEGAIISFGGYGFYRYNNDLVKKYPFDGRSEEKAQLADISPRYSSATALRGNTLYVFGGRGNKTGRQELFPQNFYDFYAINLQTNQANKLWGAEKLGDGDFMPSENMVYDAERDCFYVFTTQAGGTLLKITTEEARAEKMSFSLENSFEAQYLYLNLYYSPRQNKLLAIINQTDTDNKAKISVHTINYPPIAVETLLRHTPPVNEPKTLAPFLIIGITALLLCLAAAVAWHVKRKRKYIRVTDVHIPGPQETSFDPATNTTTPAPEPKERKAKKKEETALVPMYDFSKASVCFLGGFRVRDKDGEDITSVFTPTLKALLIQLVLFTGENSRGISGSKMLQLLWGDKNENSARNNRNVYLSKLRTIRERIGNMEVVTEGGFWSIQFGDDVVCDYLEAMRYLKMLKENRSVPEEEYNKLLELLLRGALLPNMEIEWIDRFKSDFSNLTIDTLSELLTSEDNLSADLKFRIAETLFQHDFINEEALHIKCKILSESGKMGLAKTFYDNYCREYFNLLGTKYKYSLTEVIEGKHLEG